MPVGGPLGPGVCNFPHHFIQIWDLEDGRCGRGMPGVSVPLAPFCGVMGVALAEPGQHSTIPPRRVGGNMDVRQLTAGQIAALRDYHIAEAQYKTRLTADDFNRYPITDALVAAFRAYLATKPQFNVSDAQVNNKLDYVRSQLRREIISTAEIQQQKLDFANAWDDWKPL